jgi:hypothetical protein
VSAQPPRRVLADTSVLIEPLSEHEIDAHALADAVQAISAMSIAELHKGVLLAVDADQRAIRLRRLTTVEASHEALALDTAAARVFGSYMAHAKRTRQRLRVRDGIIAATAQAHGLTVLSRDGDFERFDAELIRLTATTT